VRVGAGAMLTEVVVRFVRLDILFTPLFCACKDISNNRGDCHVVALSVTPRNDFVNSVIAQKQQCAVY
jgi:hypothetical protein